jgi:hypothetical protein
MTRDGTAHPVTQLGGAGELPALAGWNHLGALRPGAPSLLTAPGGEPLLVLGDAGAGRVAVLGTDSMWTWAFAEADAPASGRAYEALLDHLVRWLTRDPAFDAVRIRAAGEESREGRPLAMRACIQSGAASSGQDLVWRARWTGLAAAAPLDVVGTVHTGDDGCGEVALPAASAGGWLVAVEGSPDGRTVQGEARIAVHPDRRSEEARRAARITAALPPPFLPLLPPPPLVRRVLPDTVPLTWEVSRPLWRHPLVLVLLAGLMALDWALRRRHGIL